MPSTSTRPLTLTALLVAAALACTTVPAAAATREQALKPSPTPSATAGLDNPGSPDEVDQNADNTEDDTDIPASEGGSWLSGASGEGAADGALGQWRGDPVDIVGTWADQGDNQTELYSIAPGGEVADFAGAIDIAPGGLLKGDTWAAAADGVYDDRWRESLTRMAELRAGKGTTYIRPFHEFNLGGAYPWAVTPDQAGDFTTAWKRYRAIQQEVFPEAKLVYGVNVTSSGTDLDWRTTWPGAGQADVLGVDSYNGWPTITSEGDFQAQLDARGDAGIPIGLNAYSEQAKDWGVPLAVPEWSGRAEMGDEPAYVTGMVDWFAENAGDGPGQLEYEILFNAPQDDGNFQLFADDVRMPESAQAYVEATEATAEQRMDAPKETKAGTARTSDAPGERPLPTTEPSTPTDSTDSFDSKDSEPATSSDVKGGDLIDESATSAGAVTQEEFNRLAQRLDELLARLDQG